MLFFGIDFLGFLCSFDFQMCVLSRISYISAEKLNGKRFRFSLEIVWKNPFLMVSIENSGFSEKFGEKNDVHDIFPKIIFLMPSKLSV